jgi:YVTN family beta-propeller protein
MKYSCKEFTGRFGESIDGFWFLTFILFGILSAFNIASAAPFVYVGNHFSSDVTVIDAATDTVVTTIPGVYRPHGAAITPDGTRAYVTNYGYDLTVSVIDTKTNAIVGTVYGVGYDPGGIAITPDGTRAYVANRVSDNVSVIDIATNTVVATVATADYPVAVAITPDSGHAYVANQTGRRITIINTATNTVESTINDNTRHVGIAITPDGLRAYVVNDENNTFSVIDTVTKTVIATVPTGGTSPYWVAISPDGSRAYVTNIASTNVSVINTATNSVVALVPVGVQPYKLAVTPNGKKVYVGNLGSDNVSVIDTVSNSVIATIPAGDGPLALAITPVLKPDIEVDPSAYDFGDVVVGNQSATYVTVSNNGGGDLTINNIYFRNQAAGNPFTFQLPSTPPITLSPNSSLNVEVKYSPTLIFTPQNNSLVIESDDEDEGVIEVPITGRGVLANEPSQAVSGLLGFIDYALENGLIAGVGPGNSADNKVNALKNMIKSVGDLIAKNSTQAACGQLNSIYKKVDGIPKPPDFISGEAVSGVADGVLDIMTGLNCPAI